MRTDRIDTNKLAKVIAVMFGVLVLAILVPTFQSDSAPPPRRNPIDNVHAAAKMLITQRLKAPSTAVFPSVEEWMVAPLENGAFGLRAWVESQNAFGVQLREHFIARVTYHGNDYWTLDKLVFEE